MWREHLLPLWKTEKLQEKAKLPTEVVKEHPRLLIAEFPLCT